MSCTATGAEKVSAAMRQRYREWLVAPERNHSRVFAAKLQADLVVLSACRTALGKQVRGEGMIGLTRGLMHAGAKSVVATLWDVDDDSTSMLMKHFYGELKKGTPPDAALRKAQLQVRQVPRWSAPWFWGGFVLHGDWR